MPRPESAAGFAAPITLNGSAMPVISKRSKTHVALFLTGVAIYGVGVYLTRAFLCQPLGTWVLIGAIAIGGAASASMAISGFQQRSARLVFCAVAALVLLAAMFAAIGVLTLPGCSGV